MTFLIASLALFLAIAALAIALYAVSRVRSFEPLPRGSSALRRESFSLPEPSALVGFRVGLAIEQDHKNPLFAKWLERELVACDVRSVAVFDEADDNDLVIRGKVVCNGYSEIYWSAELSASDRSGDVVVMTEKPPHGDRQSNLAIELVSALDRELRGRRERQERQRALGELGS